MDYCDDGLASFSPIWRDSATDLSFFSSFFSWLLRSGRSRIITAWYRLIISSNIAIQQFENEAVSDVTVYCLWLRDNTDPSSLRILPTASYPSFESVGYQQCDRNKILGDSVKCAQNQRVLDMVQPYAQLLVLTVDDKDGRADQLLKRSRLNEEAATLQRRLILLWSLWLLCLLRSRQLVQLHLFRSQWSMFGGHYLVWRDHC